MPYAGRSVTVRPEEDCLKSYKFVQKFQLPFAIQNAWTQPYAQTYVANLLKEAPNAQQSGKLAVVTGVTIGGAGYNATEELALQGGMHVVLLGRNEGKLKAAIEAIEQEAVRRKVEKPVLYETMYDLDSLESAKSAADYVTKLAKEKYDGKLHVLLNNAGVTVGKPTLTKDGIEANVGRNFVTVHYLTDLLLPVMKKAATPDYKPRVVDVSSIAHAFGADFSPASFLESPKQGGAPPGRVEEMDDGSITFPKDPNLEGLAYMYGRAKMAVAASIRHKQSLHPELNFTCLHPGSIASNFGSDMGIFAKVYYYGFYFFQYVPSQGAVASLRACLDPDFNNEPDLQGAYLHADGNPWVTYPPEAINPATKEAYTREEYGKATLEAADDVIKKCLA